jgi:LCP family protein required for cell wall assembly
MSVSQKALLILLVAVLAACSASSPAGVPLAQAPNQVANATPTAPLFQVPGDATPTSTPFQPLPPTPIYLPTDMPTATPAPEIQPVQPQIGGAVGVIERPKGQVNLLLLGSDARSRQKLFRTDTIILASLNPEQGTVDLVSFPRDLYVDIPGWGQDRINTAWFHGGYDKLAATLEHNFGVVPDHYVLINFSSFKKLVDSLGGLDVRVGEPLTDRYGSRTITIPKGVTRMNADMVLWYVRSRKTSNDFARNRRQQEILQALAEKLISMNAIRRAPELYAAYKESVTTDLTLIDMLTFLPLAARLTDSSNIHQHFIGPKQVNNWITPGGAMVLLPVQDEIMRVIRKALKSE